MRYLNQLIFTLAAAVSLHPPAFAQYTQNFEADSTAHWTVNGGPSDEAANFFFDYATVGIPPAPGGTGTHGMKLQANLLNGVFSGFSVTPTALNLTGDYVVSFDWWANYNGPFPINGNGSTNLSTFGIGTVGEIAQWPATSGGPDCVWFAATGDGGSGFGDYRAYSSAAPTGYLPLSFVYAGGSYDAADSYYARFGGVAAPAAQLSLYPQQIGLTPVGAAGMQWHQVAIIKSNGLVNWWIDGLLIATIDLSTVNMQGGKIFFGHSDVNAASSNDPNASNLLFTLIDNVTVRPATMHGGPALNIDINTAASGAAGAGAPSSGFGAAAGQPGVWNAFTDLAVGPMPLVGLNGSATPVTITRSSSGGGDFFANNPNTSRDFEKLLDDGQDIGSATGAGSGRVYAVRGLRPGAYEIYTYAIAPDISTYTTRIGVNWCIVQEQDVGGVMPVNGFAQNVTHSVHHVTLSTNGILTFTLSTVVGFGSINGIQIKPMLTMCPADINGSGAVNVADLLSVISAWGPCGNPSDCPADVSPIESGDNAVNVNDLLLVISMWGACRL